MISFEEYSKIQFDALKMALSAFPEEEIRKYWEANQDWVKESYNSFIKNNKKNPLSDGLSYAMALDF